MSERPFPDLLRDQIRHEFTAAQQYLAAAVYFDALRLPRLAEVCYDGAEDKRAHALRMIQYLLDRDLEVRVGGLDEIVSTFDSPRGALEFLLRREQRLTEQITALAGTARASNDYLGEQFTQWFLEDQVTEVARMNTLLAVCDRAEGNLFDVEQFVARELRMPPKPDTSAPKMAGAVRLK
ncbi:ferritin [Nocardia sp. CDC159]|uniref:Ferritin n=1 Tax=Nocardia pulmonis TaxID=2951408 RepID=A0A9X2EEW5_9NOCA|nr:MULTISPECIES: ferritin [Nocardia]MCM6776896.1 ferritin [Nocardia pulmonis]MCM6789320.1 ferritin [Nocardia sp. CDC159]